MGHPFKKLENMLNLVNYFQYVRGLLSKFMLYFISNFLILTLLYFTILTHFLTVTVCHVYMIYGFEVDFLSFIDILDWYSLIINLIVNLILFFCQYTHHVQLTFYNIIIYFTVIFILFLIFTEHCSVYC